MKDPIFFDARMWNHPGIGRYIRELLKTISQLNSSMSFKIFGDEKAEAYFHQTLASAQFEKTNCPIYSLREQWELPSRFRAAPLLHVPHFNVPIAYSGKLIVTIHDLAYVRRPAGLGSPIGAWYAGALIRKATDKAHAIITVSEFTKKDLLSFNPNLDPNKITVTHEACASIFYADCEREYMNLVKAKHGIERPFVLFVGSLKAHKNVGMLIRAMVKLRENGLNTYDLVLVGRPDPKNQEVRRLIDGQHGNFIKTLGEVADEELSALYQAAEVFVLPSLWEGFGLPVLEAMASGTPVIASNATSLPEIGGEGARYFDPTHVDALAELLYNVLHDEALRRQMSEAGRRRAALFSWQATALKTLNVYQSIYG